MDLEDFLVSDIILPIGSLCFILFCVSKKGWGWDKFISEANTGKYIIQYCRDSVTRAKNAMRDEIWQHGGQAITVRHKQMNTEL